MYLNYWGFKEFPFENVPDPRFFYLSRSHEEGLTRLIYATQMRKGGAMLSGDIGCGKTTLSRVFMKELPGNKYDIGLIINPKLRPLEFLQEVLYQFDIKNIPGNKGDCLRALNQRMLDNLKNNKETLLIVDEAQLLNEQTMEEVRLLLNFQLNDRFLLTILLLGQPELRDLIKGLKPLEQRIAIRFHLTPFDFDDSIRYIRFRLRKAGAKKNVFSREAAEKIYEHTLGVPRKINNLCDLSLLIGFSQKEPIIYSRIIERVINDGAIF